MPLTPGTRLGPYEITAQIGVGGMGEVYRATDRNLGRDVAIKVLPEAFAQDAERLARFEREARTLASLNHPNIATIHGLEQSDGVRALVMELVEGPTLADRISRGALPTDEALAVAREIAAALEAAHEQGIIHRDLKPANVKVRDDGTVKVLDFGLAKMVGGPAEAGHYGSGPAKAGNYATLSPTITTPAITQLGVILGTAAYMAPEQAKGKLADKRSDVWAFGCVLYEMLTGARAFAGEDITDTIAAVVRATPDWSRLPADTPQGIRRLMRRCLEKDRSDRLPDIGAARLEIKEALANYDGDALPASTPVRSSSHVTSRFAWSLAAIAGITGAAVASLAVWTLEPRRIPASPARFSISLLEGQSFTGASRHFVAISKDGTRLAYVANGQIYLRDLAEPEARPIAGAESPLGLVNPVFSPDGESLVFVSVGDGFFKRIGVAGGVPVTLGPASPPYGIRWEGDSILFAQAGGTLEDGRGSIRRISANGGTPETLLTVKEGELAFHPQVLPDDDTMLFTLAPSRLSPSERWQKAEVVIQSLKDGRRATLVNGADGRYLPTGHLVYAVGGVVFAAPFDLRQRKLTGQSVPVIEGVRRSVYGTASGAAQFVVSDSGTLAYVPGPTSIGANERVLFVSDRNGSRIPLNVAAAPYLHPRASRDGKYLAVATDDGKNADVWIYEFAGRSVIRRLTFGGRNLFPIWSPDGRVAFQSNRDGDRAIFTQRVDGSGVTRLTKPEKDVAHVPEAWSSDGRTMLFSALKDSRFQLFTLSLAEGRISRFGDVESAEPIGATFSPDGRWVAYATSDTPGARVTQNRGVYVQPFPATGVRHQAPKNRADFHPAWGPSGNELFFIPTASQLVRVSVETQPGFAFVGTSNVPSLTVDRISTDVRDYDVLPDGRFVATTAADDSGSGAAGTSQIRIVLNWFEELKRRVK